MISFSTRIQKFNSKAEKTGWTFILVPREISEKINPGVKKSYRIKGFLDDYEIQGMNLLPMGEGDFILALNAAIRKQVRKKNGDLIKVQIDLDATSYQIDRELMNLLDTEPKALAFFQSLARSHQNYFSKWIESAKTLETRHERLATTINALLANQNYAEMIRARKNNF